MWHQIQLMAAMRQSNALQDAVASASPGSGAQGPQSAATSSSSTSLQPGAEPVTGCVDSNLSIAEWPIPALPPTITPENDDTTKLRALAQQAVTECFQNELAESTVKAYDTMLRLEVDFAARSLDVDLLPMIHESQLTALFGAMLARRWNEKVNLKWSRVRTLKSALVHCRKRRHTTCVFDRWSHAMGAFSNVLVNAFTTPWEKSRSSSPMSPCT